jgi:hypothetical protein
MLIMVMGVYRDGADFNSPEVADRLNEELTFEKIRLAGQLRDGSGAKGFAVVLTAGGFEDGEAYLRESRFFGADLFREVRVLEYRLEVGRVD